MCLEERCSVSVLKIIPIFQGKIWMTFQFQSETNRQIINLQNAVMYHLVTGIIRTVLLGDFVILGILACTYIN